MGQSSPAAADQPTDTDTETVPAADSPQPVFERLILHVGSHKTGTSAIQRCADGNRALLLEDGILYPQTGQWPDKSHHNWAFTLLHAASPEDSDAAIDALVDELRAEIAQYDTAPPVGLLSSEILEKLPARRDKAPLVRHFLSRLAGSVQVVVFFRRQDLLVESVFKQWVKDPAMRLRIPVEDFLERQKTSLDYHRIAQSWQALPEVEEVLIHTNALVQNPITSFFGMIGFEDTERFEEDSDVIVNPSLDGEKLELKYFLNCAALSQQDDQKVLGHIQKFDLPRETVSIFSETARRAYIDAFADSNAALCDAFGLEPFQDDMPRRDRNLRPLSGRVLKGALDQIAETDEKLTWALYRELARLVGDHCRHG